MLLDFGWSEILLIGIVALVVIGPKDLPKAMRVAGYWIKKARALSQEFHNSVDEVIREAELEEMRQELRKATEIDLDREFERTIDPDGSLAEGLRPPELPDFSEPAAAPKVEPELAAEEPEIEPDHPGTTAHARPQTVAADPGVGTASTPSKP
jgi:sec-independent protein translocase protein TatB